MAERKDLMENQGQPHASNASGQPPYNAPQFSPMFTTTQDFQRQYQPHSKLPNAAKQQQQQTSLSPTRTHTNSNGLMLQAANSAEALPDADISHTPKQTGATTQTQSSPKIDMLEKFPKTKELLLKEGQHKSDALLNFNLRNAQNFNHAISLALDFRREDVMEELLNACKGLGFNYQTCRFLLLKTCCERFVYTAPEEWMQVIALLLKYQLYNEKYYKELLLAAIQTISDASIVPPDLGFRFNLTLFWKLYDLFKTESLLQPNFFIKTAFPLFNELLNFLKNEILRRSYKATWLARDPLHQDIPKPEKKESATPATSPNGTPEKDSHQSPAASNLSASISSFTIKAGEALADSLSHFTTQISNKTGFLPRFLAGLQSNTVTEEVNGMEPNTPEGHEKLGNLLSFDLECEEIDKKETHEGLNREVQLALQAIDAEIKKLSENLAQCFEIQRRASFGASTIQSISAPTPEENAAQRGNTAPRF